MNFSEDIFKYKSLTTNEMDALTNVKNSLYKKNSKIPLTLETVAADEFPKNANRRISKTNHRFERNWICNTNSSDKSGTHWICVLTMQKPANNEDRVKNCMCIYQNYYLIDSWGNTVLREIFQDILNTLNEHRQRLHRLHKIARKKSFYVSDCKCKFEIILPITHRIQKFDYVNCGWYALFFTQFNEDTLFNWIRNNVKEGMIKQSYVIMRNYFTIFFSKSACKLLEQIKNEVEKNSKNNDDCKRCLNCISLNNCKL